MQSNIKYFFDYLKINLDHHINDPPTHFSAVDNNELSIPLFVIYNQT